ncbi:hypothetical protein ACFL4I_01150 [Pseudomonadota bacterium]
MITNVKQMILLLVLSIAICVLPQYADANSCDNAKNDLRRAESALQQSVTSNNGLHSQYFELVATERMVCTQFSNTEQYITHDRKPKCILDNRCANKCREKFPGVPSCPPQECDRDPNGECSAIPPVVQNCLWEDCCEITVCNPEYDRLKEECAASRVAKFNASERLRANNQQVLDAQNKVQKMRARMLRRCTQVATRRGPFIPRPSFP